MEIKLIIRPEFEAVLLINGALKEAGEIVYRENEVVYITVLPLSALLLPYTVKMVGGRVKSNGELAKSYILNADRFHLKLLPRYNYVYSVTPAAAASPDSLPERFFLNVQAGKIQEARSCLSRELSDSIDDKSLTGFFDGFCDILASDKAKGEYYLIDTDDRGTPYSFVLKNGVIDNIIGE